MLFWSFCVLWKFCFCGKQILERVEIFQSSLLDNGKNAWVLRLVWNEALHSFDRIRSLCEILGGHSRSWGEQAFSSPKIIVRAVEAAQNESTSLWVFFIKLEAEICRPQCLYGSIPQIGNTLVVQDRGRLLKISSRIVLSARGRAMSRRRQRS